MGIAALNLISTIVITTRHAMPYCTAGADSNHAAAPSILEGPCFRLSEVYRIQCSRHMQVWVFLAFPTSTPICA